MGKAAVLLAVCLLCSGVAHGAIQEREVEYQSGGLALKGLLASATPAKPGVVKAQILVLTGGADPYVPKDQFDAFDREMRPAGAQYRVVVYPGVKHSFTNPAATELGKQFDIPDEYNADADQKSWQEVLRFFRNL